MKHLKFSAILIAFAASVLWIAAAIVSVFDGYAEGLINAGVILYIISLIPLLIDSKVEERRAR